MALFTPSRSIASAPAVAFYESTKVRFAPLSVEAIAAYIRTGEPMDKAGAYGIQVCGSGVLMSRTASSRDKCSCGELSGRECIQWLTSISDLTVALDSFELFLLILSLLPIPPIRCTGYWWVFCVGHIWMLLQCHGLPTACFYESSGGSSGRW